MKKLIAVLSSRLIMFLFFQTIIAILLSSWNDSVKYWPVTSTFTNLISIIILIILLNEEYIPFFSLFRFQKDKFKTDAIWFTVLLILSVPLAIAPSLALSNLLWGTTEYYHKVLFQPVNRTLAYVVLVAYPLSTGLAELPTYFGYVMPRLKERFTSQAAIIALPAIAFSVQHCTLPFVAEVKFVMFRGIMYLLFCLVYGFAIYRRPSLLPWLVILQVLIYILPMTLLLAVK
jgi:hypothetical protein